MTTARAAFEIRRAADRGTTELGWLHSRHSFSFGGYYDPARISFRSLRVLNDDVVEPGRGFGEHGHDNMEIITWVLEGELAHEDSTGTRGVIRPGDVQVMSAGRGIHHSEMNASNSAPVHFLQIWIEPAGRDLEPRYAQRSLPGDGRRDRWQLIASSDAREGSLGIHQDALVRLADLGAGRALGLALDPGRHGYLHVAFGTVRIGTATLGAGDAVAITTPGSLDIEAVEDGQLLFFDLP